MPRLIDLTRPLSTTTPPWPGDVGVTLIHHARISDGYSCNVGQLTLSLHNGTHADAPYHYSDHGATIDQIPLETYLGPAWVIEASGLPALTADLFANLDFTHAPRVLIRTGAWTNPTHFPTAWPVLAPGVAAHLGAAGVKLIGLDAPSVDVLTSKDLTNHHALHRANIVIIENLDLSAAPLGCHELIAAPLRLVGGDGSPLRAVLRVAD